MIRSTGLCLVLLLCLGACRSDETLAGYGAGERVWRLASLDGQPFDSRATIRFGARGAVSGLAPCNSWRSEQTAPYPWFSLGRIGATRLACPRLDDEAAYFAALGEMSLAEVSGDVLVLSNDAGRIMVFQSEMPSG